MSQINNAMEIFKLLDKSNCKECNEATCLAFAAAVFQGQKQLDECPNLESDIIKRFGGKNEKRTTLEQDMNESVEQLKRKIATVDLASSAQRLGATFSDDKLTIKILGKDFRVDSKGNLSSDIHIHPWVTVHR
jgi:Na+-translocating ferredoxin:NAD+ oxidoreductase RNF subunit RnfB